MKIHFRLEEATITGILIIAILLRVWGLNAGLPLVLIHIDENALVNLSLAIVPEKGALWTSGSGFLMPYLIFPFYAFYFLAGNILGHFPNQESFLKEYLIHTGNFILIGRLVNTAISVLTIFFVYITGKKWFSRKLGLLAAFFLSVSFIHVKESHYLKNDILAGLITLVIYFIACKIVEQGKIRWYVLAGVLTGLAFTVKFYPVFAGTLILIAHFLRILLKKNTGLLNLYWSLISFTLTVLIFIFPTFLLRPDSFSEFLRIKNIVLEEINPKKGEFILLTYIFGHLKEGLGLPILIAAFLGLLAVAKNIKKYQYFLLIFFPVFFLASVNLWGRYNLPRHVIVILPFFVILAALGVLFVVSQIKNIFFKNILVAILSVFLVLPTLIRTIKMDNYFLGIDTRELAKYWAEKNIPSGEKIVIEGTLKPYIPSGAIPLSLGEDSIKEQLSIAEKKNQKAMQLKELAKLNKGRATYNIISTPSLDSKYDTISGIETKIFNTDFYIKNGVKYIASSSWAHYYNPLNSEFENNLDNTYTVIATFNPDVVVLGNPHDTSIDYRGIDKIPLFSKKLIVGPVIKIYKQN